MISWKTSRLIRLLAHPVSERGCARSQNDREKAGLSINYSILSGEVEGKRNKKVTLYFHSIVYSEHGSTVHCIVYSVQYSDTQRENIRANVLDNIQIVYMSLLMSNFVRDMINQLIK